MIVTASYGDLEAILLEEDSWAARQRSSREASSSSISDSSGDDSSAIFGAHWHWKGASPADLLHSWDALVPEYSAQ